ncbi:TPR-like protein [Gonapodya prolifera JEL478]|uniref:Pre-mRNA-splicing factor SYF1 n=1 Tax=Gonapodya prolifera (strain JEL478) TaxID=1344416 RepID=A0A139A5G8_GONPJ|nr:TPR-like protein [Gonapodya prolifera JEL478]|eukprot:KXS11643.1 TPR-like protein [Gonapodya prolifera JEL478]
MDGDATSSKSGSGMELLDKFITPDDLALEEHLLRHPYVLKNWLTYIDKKRTASHEARIFIFDRAVKELPGSYKLWKMYLDFRTSLLIRPGAVPDPGTLLYNPTDVLRPINGPEWQNVNACFERALILLNKMPVIWMMYCQWTLQQAGIGLDVASLQDSEDLEGEDESNGSPDGTSINPITLARRTFDRALRALPLTQHPRIWPMYLKLAQRVSGETAMRIYRRHIQLDPNAAEDFVDILLDLKPQPKYAEAARYLTSLLTLPDFKSRHGHSTFTLWARLCDIITTHPSEILKPTPTDNVVVRSSVVGRSIANVGRVEPLEVEKFLRAGIAKFTDQVGKLWNTLAKFYILQGEFERARDIYEEAIDKVVTVRDFSMVFDAYVEFVGGWVESVVESARRWDVKKRNKLKKQKVRAQAEAAAKKAGKPLPPPPPESESESDEDELSDPTTLDLHLARLDDLMRRRPFLVNEVLLRQNPHNVHEWLRRVKLFRDAGTEFEEESNRKGKDANFDDSLKPEVNARDLDADAAGKVVNVFNQACSAINPKKASGKFSELWIEFALFYAERSDMTNARKVFEKATHVSFKKVDELVEVWIQWCETELILGDVNTALEVIGRATSPPPGKTSGGVGGDMSIAKATAMLAHIRYTDETIPPQQRICKSPRLWNYYVDLAESMADPVDQTATNLVRSVYDRILELKVATPQTVVDYATWLEGMNYWEESFKVYEKGISLFGWPIAFDLWNLYLSRFLGRYGGSKLERARDLFETALTDVPPKYAKPLYLAYAKLEEEHGLAKHAMRIYDRATSAAAESDRHTIFQIYLSKAATWFGLPSTREIYQKAIENLPDKHAMQMCLRFSDLETKLGEVDRARQVLAYGSQFADPRVEPGYWKAWHGFEVRYGNEDTFKEMLRIKRSVQAKFNTEVAFISAQILAAKASQNPSADPTKTSAMELLEREAVAAEEEAALARERAEELRERREAGLGSMFVKAKRGGLEGTVGSGATPAEQGETAQQATNPEAIDIGMDDDDEDGKGGDGDGEEVEKEGAGQIRLQEKSIPEGVFGGLLKRVAREADGEDYGEHSSGRETKRRR